MALKTTSPSQLEAHPAAGSESGYGEQYPCHALPRCPFPGISVSSLHGLGSGEVLVFDHQERLLLEVPQLRLLWFLVFLGNSTFRETKSQVRATGAKQQEEEAGTRIPADPHLLPTKLFNHQGFKGVGISK